MRLAIVIATLAGCTYPEKELIEPRFACMLDPDPTTATPLVSIQGITIDPFVVMNGQPMVVPSVTLTLQSESLATLAGPIASDATTGAFAFSFNTSSTPVPVVIKAEATDRVTTYHVPARPITADYELPFTVMSNAQRQMLATDSLGMPFTAGKGVMLMSILDCNNMPVEGATVRSSPAGQARYFNGIIPSKTRTSTDVGGVAMVAELTPGTVSLTAEIDGLTFPARTFSVTADEVVQTFIMP